MADFYIRRILSPNPSEFYLSKKKKCPIIKGGEVKMCSSSHRNEDTLEKKWKYGIDLGNSVFDFPSLIVLSTHVFHGIPHTKSFSECTLTKMALLVQTYLVHNSLSQNQTWGKRIMEEWGLMKVFSGWWENSIDKNKTKHAFSVRTMNQCETDRFCALKHSIVCE